MKAKQYNKPFHEKIERISQDQRRKIYINNKDFCDEVTMDKILSSLTEWELKQLIPEGKIIDLDLQNYFSLEKMEINLINEEGKQSIINNTGIEKISLLKDLFGELFYYLEYHSIKEDIQTFKGKPVARVIKAIAYQFFKQQNVNEPMKMADTLTVKDQLLLCMAMK